MTLYVVLNSGGMGDVSTDLTSNETSLMTGVRNITFPLL